MQLNYINKNLLRWFLPVAIVVLSVLLLHNIFSQKADPIQEIAPENGILDIRNVDVSSGVINIVNNWDFYPSELYTSQDFAAGTVGEKSRPEESASDTPYGTHRLRILAQPNQYYTICSFSLDYASRVFVNGSEVATFGTVADNAADFVPKVGYMTIPMYSGENGEIEIIYQYGNYVHKNGGYIQPTYLSTPQIMERFKAANDLVSLSVSGGLLLLMLYFLLSAAVRRKADFLCLALCCLVMALRDQNFLNIHLLPADTSWYFVYRTLILIVMLMPVSILLLLKCMYDKATRRWPLYVYLGMTAIAAMLICVLPTQDLVSVSTAVYYASIPYLLYLLFGVARHYIKQRRLEATDILVLFGFLILLAGLLYEAFLTGHSAEVTHYGTAAYGMLGFIFLNAAAINLQIQQREAALIESRSRGEMLERMNRLNMDFLHKVAHELKTPLTVISGYAQLTGMQLAADHISDETLGNLKTIQQEAQRLADMVTRLMEYSYGRKSELSFGRIIVPELLENVGAVGAPMCLKNGNAVKIVASPCADVHGNFEMLLQIFINLVVNANKNTQNGTITIRAFDNEQEGFVLFRVEDTGSGILPQDLPHIFEQGFSASGSSGLGLTICREAVEAHGGEIWVERTGPEGTVFAFTVLKEEPQ